MKKTIFQIAKMDCPSEESLIRMKLDGISEVRNLEFDIPNRILAVYHTGNLEEIEGSVLNRDSERIPRCLSMQSGDPAIGVAGLASEL